MFHFFGAVIIGTLIGYLAEKFNFTRNGVIVSIALAVGGAMILTFSQSFLGIGLGLGLGRPATSAIGAVALLAINAFRR